MRHRNNYSRALPRIQRMCSSRMQASGTPPCSVGLPAAMRARRAISARLIATQRDEVGRRRTDPGATNTTHACCSARVVVDRRSRFVYHRITD
jgi:hypothetical protein